MLRNPNKPDDRGYTKLRRTAQPSLLLLELTLSVLRRRALASTPPAQGLRLVIRAENIYAENIYAENI